MYLHLIILGCARIYLSRPIRHVRVLHENWKQMTRDDMDKFVADNHMKYGKDLCKAMEVNIQSRYQRVTTNSFKAII